MLNSFIINLTIGILLGTMAGMGLGGGSLLVLWLTVVLQLPPENARIINLLFFIPSALISSLIRAKKSKNLLKRSFPAILCGCLSAVVFSLISSAIDESVLKKLFAILLIIAGLKELFYRERKAK